MTRSAPILDSPPRCAGGRGTLPTALGMAPTGGDGGMGRAMSNADGSLSGFLLNIRRALPSLRLIQPKAAAPHHPRSIFGCSGPRDGHLAARSVATRAAR